MRGQARLARYAAPAAFLLAVTVAILLVRAGLDNGGASTPPPAATTTDVTPTTTEDPGTTQTGTVTVPADAEFYEIQSGDTLAVIADQHDTTVEQLLVLNPDVDPVALTVGQRIRVK
ncbi:MAG: LysM domain [Solirubrobacteraceae bacterium]|nr:LysM domain [Solirubrobacteraceae bacterium]